MFGLFNKKNTYRPTVTPEDKDWIEKNIIWFIEVFGFEKIKKQPFLLPTIEIFPYTNVKETQQFQKLFEQLCLHWDLNPNEITVNFFDDIKSKQWTKWVMGGELKEPKGIYNQIYTTEEKRFQIQLAKSNLDNVELLVYVLAHELAHVKLLGGNYINRDSPDMEPLTDLATIYFGFGIFVANSCETKDINWTSRSGYLPNQLISYTNALICYITDQDAKNYYAVLNNNTKDLFKQDFEFLSKTNDTALTKFVISESEASYKISEQINKGFEKRIFEDVIEGCKLLLEKDPKNSYAFNNIGYAYLLQKNYEEAINNFTKAIDIDPFWDYPYNNRGYCKLQLGELEDANLDIYYAYSANPQNSFSWRNLGAFYLKINDFTKALQNFIVAEEIDPKTELINFYLSHAYYGLGEFDKAKFYMDKSKALNEYNDSSIE